MSKRSLTEDDFETWQTIFLSMIPISILPKSLIMIVGQFVVDLQSWGRRVLSEMCRVKSLVERLDNMRRVQKMEFVSQERSEHFFDHE
jgi:hypothetical protein